MCNRHLTAAIAKRHLQHRLKEIFLCCGWRPVKEGRISLATSCKYVPAWLRFRYAGLLFSVEKGKNW